jgi:hypothetical protein
VGEYGYNFPIGEPVFLLDQSYTVEPPYTKKFLIFSIAIFRQKVVKIFSIWGIHFFVRSPLIPNPSLKRENQEYHFRMTSKKNKNAEIPAKIGG